MEVGGLEVGAVGGGGGERADEDEGEGGKRVGSESGRSVKWEGGGAGGGVGFTCQPRFNVKVFNSCCSLPPGVSSVGLCSFRACHI